MSQDRVFHLENFEDIRYEFKTQNVICMLMLIKYFLFQIICYNNQEYYSLVFPTVQLEPVPSGLQFYNKLNSDIGHDY